MPFFYNYFHRHKETQVTLILKGEGTLIVGNYTQPFKAGDIYVIGANQPHIFKSDPAYFKELQDDSAHAIHIFFDQSRILNSFIDIPEMEPIQKFLDSTCSGLQLPPEHFDKVCRSIKKISEADKLKRLLYFLKLLQHLSNNVRDWKSLSTGLPNLSFTESEGIRMNDVYQYTISHYAENITLEKIASVAHITPHAFCKYFKKHTNKTYNTFLNEVRINEACKKIMSGNFDCIASIAYSTGFNSAINFNKVFKKIMGLSPSEYIKEYKYSLKKQASSAA
ncbi:AraC family transcriptional regulator [Pontibacter ruber]|uniref:AraC family transcriptional regulator n=2 Tax=Pontibacter ruber TaxID=1343895 RepID=A0ABW5D1X5_9BACT